MLKRLTLTASVSTAALLLAGGASAASYTYDFTGGNSPSTGPFGNTRVFSSTPGGGPNVTASAYAAISTSTAITAAYLGHYGPGLGVTNAGLTIPLPFGGSFTIPDLQHQTDNLGLIDLVLFHFAEPIDVTGIKLTSYGDADIKAWFGNSYTGGSINGDFGLTDLGNFNCSSACNGFGEVVTYDLDPSATLGSYLLIAAKPSDSDDNFKIRQLTVEYTTTGVSEPGTLAAFGIGLAALGYLGRRRKAA